MARRRKGVVSNVMMVVAQAKAAANRALQGLRAEINATKKRLDTLTAEAPGFQTHQVSAFPLTAKQDAIVNITLRLGATNQTVEQPRMQALVHMNVG